MAGTESLEERRKDIELVHSGICKDDDPQSLNETVKQIFDNSEVALCHTSIPFQLFVIFELALEFSIFITSCVLLHQVNQYTLTAAPMAIFIFVTRIFPMVTLLYQKEEWFDCLWIFSIVSFAAGDILRIALVIYTIAVSQNFADGNTPSNVIYATYFISEALLFLLPVFRSEGNIEVIPEDIMQRISFMLGIISLASACASFTVAADLSAVDKGNAAILFLASILALPMSFILLLNTSYNIPPRSFIHLLNTSDDITREDGIGISCMKWNPEIGLNSKSIRSNLKLLSVIGSVIGIIICSVGIQNGDKTLMALVIHILTFLNVPEYVVSSGDIIDAGGAPMEVIMDI